MTRVTPSGFTRTDADRAAFIGRLTRSRVRVTPVHTRRVSTWLAWFVGLTFIVFGAVEVAVRVFSSEPIDAGTIAFWFLSLCGGGSLILAGRFLVTRPSWASKCLVAVGCFAGMVATMWTLVLPVLAGTLLVLTVIEQPDRAVQPEAGPADRVAEP
jgi:hypothetical protein